MELQDDGQEASASWSQEDRAFMKEALKEAEKARRQREVPVGCVIVRDGAIVGRGHNLTNETRNGTRHAEFEAIDQVLRESGGRVAEAGFSRCQLYVTVEPCIMCAGALALLGFKEVVFGCGNDRFGGAGSILDVHERGCGSCGPAGKACADRSGADPQGSQHEAVPAAADTAEQAPAGQQGSCQVGQCPPGASYYNHRGFPCRKGLYADAAVKQLQDFYIAGNPAAPRPHRPVRTPIT